MSSNLPPIPHRTPIIDFNGFVNQAWSDWFQRLFLRVGGNIAETNDELYSVDTVRIEDGAVTAAKIAAAVAGNGLTGGSGSALAVNPDGSTIEINSDAIRVKDLGISTSKIANDAVSFVKQLSTDWSNSKTSSGYQKLPSGIYIQWGTASGVTSGSTSTPSFSTSFPTACLHVIAGVKDNSAVATTSTGQWGTGSYSTTGFSLYNRTSVTLDFNWIAVGY